MRYLEPRDGQAPPVDSTQTNKLIETESETHIKLNLINRNSTTVVVMTTVSRRNEAKRAEGDAKVTKLKPLCSVHW